MVLFLEILRTSGRECCQVRCQVRGFAWAARSINWVVRREEWMYVWLSWKSQRFQTKLEPRNHICSDTYGGLCKFAARTGRFREFFLTAVRINLHGYNTSWIFGRKSVVLLRISPEKSRERRPDKSKSVRGLTRFGVSPGYFNVIAAFDSCKLARAARTRNRLQVYDSV
jgi:hypothetical protein